MLDFRLKTFLTLCRVFELYKTAKILHITQPAVSQHIKHLELEYGVKLLYMKKNLIFNRSRQNIVYLCFRNRSQFPKGKELISSSTDYHLPIHFGTTLTIGEYTMPQILSNLLKHYPKIHINMEVGNTATLLNKLENGNIDFALLEGHFNKAKYNSIIFSKESFIGICSPLNPLAKDKVSFNEIFKERLIVRELGSGSREILNKFFMNTILQWIIFLNSLKLKYQCYKNLVSQNLGITFYIKKQ